MPIVQDTSTCTSGFLSKLLQSTSRASKPTQVDVLEMCQCSQRSVVALVVSRRTCESPWRFQDLVPREQCKLEAGPLSDLRAIAGMQAAVGTRCSPFASIVDCISDATSAALVSWTDQDQQLRWTRYNTEHSHGRGSSHDGTLLPGGSAPLKLSEFGSTEVFRLDR